MCLRGALRTDGPWIRLILDNLKPGGFPLPPRISHRLGQLVHLFRRAQACANRDSHLSGMKLFCIGTDRYLAQIADHSLTFQENRS